MTVPTQPHIAVLLPCYSEPLMVAKAIAATLPQREPTLLAALREAAPE